MTGKIDDLSLREPRLLHVLRIHKEHAAPVVNSAIPIIQAINMSVELIVRSDRHQDEFSRSQFVARNWMHGEKRFADFGAPRPGWNSTSHGPLTSNSLIRLGAATVRAIAPAGSRKTTNTASLGSNVKGTVVMPSWMR